jgi:hypothetical protein
MYCVPSYEQMRCGIVKPFVVARIMSSPQYARGDTRLRQVRSPFSVNEDHSRLRVQSRAEKRGHSHRE